ncbi:MAG: DUF1801 domain-containing protein [Gammaproteobacteria bacterium]|nr:DUF1801 domain-containing protein [Gammaproteobacteria bacterium]
MATLKTRPTDASIETFLDSVDNEDRREDARRVLAIMGRVTGEPARMWGTRIVGFGSYHYRYASGREGDWPLTGLSPGKRNLTVYIMPGFDEYGEMLSRLGKHRTGKSCLYVNRLRDVDLNVLEEIIRQSVADMRRRYPQG